MVSFLDTETVNEKFTSKIYIISNIHRHWALEKQDNKIRTILLPVPFSEMTEYVNNNNNNTKNIY